MIVKVRRPQGSWKMFDAASDVIYPDQPLKYRDALPLVEDKDIQANIIFDRSNIGDDPLDERVQCVEFVRHEARIMVVFNTVCFICSDQGKTLERVSL